MRRRIVSAVHGIPPRPGDAGQEDEERGKLRSTADLPNKTRFFDEEYPYVDMALTTRGEQGFVLRYPTAGRAITLKSTDEKHRHLLRFVPRA